MARETQKEKIERLEKEVQDLKAFNTLIQKEFNDLERKYNELCSDEEEKFKNLPLYQKLVEENKLLKSSRESLTRQLNHLQEKYNDLLSLYHAPKPVQHNARGAGRKPGDAKQQMKYQQFNALLNAGKNMHEIMAEMEISQATYFRYKSISKNNY